MPHTSVEQVVQADEHCVIARVARDAEPMYSEYGRTDVPRVWLVLRRLDHEQPGAAEAEEHNPTPWRIQFYGIKRGETGPPKDECG